MHYHPRPAWAIREREATPESVFFNRRAFLKGSLGMAAGSVVGMSSAPSAWAADDATLQDQTLNLYPAKRNPAFATLDRPLTKAEEAAKFNNFYEFGPVKTISILAQRLSTRPWEVKVHGLVNNPKTFWEELGPIEYGFWANVNPKFDHPRWSQAEERMLGTDEKRPTLIFNGYEKWVASMYPDLKNRRYFM